MSSVTNSDNIFNIPDPKDYECRITNLSDGHKLMSVEARKSGIPPQIFTILFRKVVYFSGCTNWKNASFRIASDDERNNLLPKHVLEHKYLSDPDIYTLFVSQDDLLVLANAAHCTDSSSRVIATIPSL